MTVSTTSKIALEKIRPTLSGRRRQVLDAIGELVVASNEKIAAYLELPINRVTGRVTELHMMSYIEVAYTARGSTGHMMKYWRLSPHQDDIVEVQEQDCA